MHQDVNFSISFERLACDFPNAGSEYFEADHRLERGMKVFTYYLGCSASEVMGFRLAARPCLVLGIGYPPTRSVDGNNAVDDPYEGTIIVYYAPGIDAFLEERTHLLDENGVELITEAKSSVNYVKAAIRLVDNLMNTDHQVFELVRHKDEKSVRTHRLGRQILKLTADHVGWYESHLPLYRINPLFTLFKRFLGPLSALHGHARTDHVDLMNNAVEKVRSFRRSPALRRRLDNIRRCQRANEASTRELCAGIRQAFNRALVVRVDLAYVSVRAGRKGYGASPVTFQQARRDRDKFLTCLRKGPYSEHVIGYVWKMEYGVDKGYHFHVAVFFDGQHRRGDICLANRLGEMWKSIATGGHGTFFNCNMRKERYERNGLGMAARDDHEKWRNVVDHAISYLWKADLFLRFQAPGKCRAFGVGGPYRR